jgi:hypothetical protein
MLFLDRLVFWLVILGAYICRGPETPSWNVFRGGGTVATTMNTYQHPARVAIVVAVLLPLLHELYRFKRGRTELA